MKKRKTWMALFLCLCMAFMLLPASVLAASAGDITIALADGSDPSLGTSGTAVMATITMKIMFFISIPERL